VGASRSERDRGSDEEAGDYGSDHYARASAGIARCALQIDATSVTKRDMVGHPLPVRGECEPRREVQQAARG
jgi:hypothetical protein